MKISSEDLFRHAVRAAEIAAVGDRNAQVAQRTPGSIDDPVTHKASIPRFLVRPRTIEAVCGPVGDFVGVRRD